MKNFEDVINEYFIELGFKNPESAIFDMSIGCSKLESAIKIERHYTEIGKRFAIEVAKEALRNAAEKLEYEYCDYDEQVDYSFITEETNIPKI